LITHEPKISTHSSAKHERSSLEHTIVPIGRDKRVDIDNSTLGDQNDLNKKATQQESLQRTPSLLEGSSISDISTIIARALAAHQAKESDVVSVQGQLTLLSKKFKSQVRKDYKEGFYEVLIGWRTYTYLIYICIYIHRLQKS
jgi:hypothetical protein